MPPLTVLDIPLDYHNRPFGAVIGNENVLAWPIGMYRVTLPKGNQTMGVVNPFERLILGE